MPTSMEQSGIEPKLSAETRSRLFTIAHNALANTFRHASASRVSVLLDFDEDWISLKVEDDGVGLPHDYAERGRGFAGMKAEAERMWRPAGRNLLWRCRGGPRCSCVIPTDATSDSLARSGSSRTSMGEFDMAEKSPDPGAGGGRPSPGAGEPGAGAG